jgi:hypothetical protein
VVTCLIIFLGAQRRVLQVVRKKANLLKEGPPNRDGVLFSERITASLYSTFIDGAGVFWHCRAG